MDIKNCKPGHVFKDAVTMNVTELILSKNGSKCVGDILFFGKPIGKTWTIDIPSDQKVEIGSVLKLDCVAELRTIRKKSSGNSYSIVVTLSEYDDAYAFFTDEDFETSTKNNLSALYKVGDIAMTTKHHGGIFPFGIGADTLVDIIDIDDRRGYSIKSRTLGITVREIGWVI